MNFKSSFLTIVFLGFSVCIKSQNGLSQFSINELKEYVVKNISSLDTTINLNPDNVPNYRGQIVKRYNAYWENDDLILIESNRVTEDGVYNSNTQRLLGSNNKRTYSYSANDLKLNFIVKYKINVKNIEFNDCRIILPEFYDFSNIDAEIKYERGSDSNNSDFNKGGFTSFNSITNTISRPRSSNFISVVIGVTEDEDYIEEKYSNIGIDSEIPLEFFQVNTSLCIAIRFIQERLKGNWYNNPMNQYNETHLNSTGYYFDEISELKTLIGNLKFYDSEWNEITSYADNFNEIINDRSIKFCRKIIDRDNDYLVIDFYKDRVFPRVQMVGTYMDENLEIKDGLFEYFDEYGRLTILRRWEKGNLIMEASSNKYYAEDEPLKHGEIYYNFSSADEGKKLKYVCYQQDLLFGGNILWIYYFLKNGDYQVITVTNADLEESKKGELKINKTYKIIEINNQVNGELNKVEDSTCEFKSDPDYFHISFDFGSQQKKQIKIRKNILEIIE